MLTPLARRSFEDVLEAELNEITKSRGFRNGAQCEVSPATDAHSVHERACGSQLVGLAFSCGGIRSATFNLGVLQGLADLGLLSRIDYLSTVSGGGYIGSWLAAWISRSCLGNVEENLRTDQAEEPRQIQFLREYSNYLTPKLGFLSGDTWAFVGSYLRNLSLNLTILVLALIALLLLVRPVVLYRPPGAFSEAEALPNADAVREFKQLFDSLRSAPTAQVPGGHRGSGWGST